MFYCDKCAKESKWPESISKSFGKCEYCGNHGPCNDRPSSSLPVVEKNTNDKLDELINRFKNGDERYRNSALMNQCIHTLARGDDPIQLIDQLLDIIEGQQDDLIKLVKNYGIRTNINIDGTNH